METQTLFMEIVKELGEGWQYVKPSDEHPDYTGCTAKHAKGWSFTLYLDGYHKKIEVWGDYPRTEATFNGHGKETVLHGDEYPKRIYISPTRTPASIAGDIKRRFMPTYEAAFNLATQRIADKKVSADKTSANVAELAKVLGVEANNNYPTELRWSNGYNSKPYIYADFKVSDDSVTIKTGSVPLDMALAIAKILKGELKCH